MNGIGSFCLFPSHFAFRRTIKIELRIASNFNQLIRRLSALIAVFACSGIAVAQVAIQTSVSTDQNSPATTISSPALTTSAANELLLAFIATDRASLPNTTVKNITGAGLTWVLVNRTNTEPGTAEIWRAFAPAVLTNVRITATLSQSVVSSMTIVGFTGAANTGTNGSGAIGAVGSGFDSRIAPTASLTATQSGSLVVGVGNDWDNAIARTPVAGQTLMHQDFSSTQDTYWVQRVNAATTAKGQLVTLADSAPATDHFNLSICEVLPGNSSGVSSPQITVNASTLAFGTVNLNTTSTKTLTLTSSGTAPLTINSATPSGSGFSVGGATFPATLKPGQTLNLQVSFKPTVAGAATGAITLSSNASSASTTKVALSGTGAGAHLTASASSLAFGNVPVSTTAAQTLTLTSSGTLAVTVNSATLTGTGFKMSGATFPATLNPGQTMSLQVSFSPIAAGAVSGTIIIASSSSAGSASTNLTKSGTGTSPVLSLSSTALNYGDDAVGTPITLPVTLTSTGTAPVTVSAASLTGTGFSFSGATFPVTLNPTIAITIQVQFDPAAVGAASGSLKFSSNSTTGSTSTVSLSGNGTAVQHRVSLSWAAPANSPVAVTGYKIYRVLGSGTAYQLLASSSSTTYVDLAVQTKTAYSYYVTSVDSGGTESSPSNQVTVTVP